MTGLEPAPADEDVVYHDEATGDIRITITGTGVEEHARAAAGAGRVDDEEATE